MVDAHKAKDCSMDIVSMSLVGDHFITGTHPSWCNSLRLSYSPQAIQMQNPYRLLFVGRGVLAFSERRQPKLAFGY